LSTSFGKRLLEQVSQIFLPMGSTNNYSAYLKQTANRTTLPGRLSVWVLERVLEARHAQDSESLLKECGDLLAAAADAGAPPPRLLDWRELSSEQRVTAIGLGWGMITWETGSRPAGALMTPWADLDEAHHNSAGALGLTESEWDAELRAAIEAAAIANGKQVDANVIPKLAGAVSEVMAGEYKANSLREIGRQLNKFLYTGDGASAVDCLGTTLRDRTRRLLAAFRFPSVRLPPLIAGSSGSKSAAGVASVAGETQSDIEDEQKLLKFEAVLETTIRRLAGDPDFGCMPLRGVPFATWIL
jgi:hypothetical protein